MVCHKNVLSHLKPVLTRGGGGSKNCSLFQKGCCGFARKAESNCSGASQLQVWSLHPTPVRVIRAVPEGFQWSYVGSRVNATACLWVQIGANQKKSFLFLKIFFFFYWNLLIPGKIILTACVIRFVCWLFVCFCCCCGYHDNHLVPKFVKVHTLQMVFLVIFLSSWFGFVRCVSFVASSCFHFFYFFFFFFFLTFPLSVYTQKISVRTKCTKRSDYSAVIIFTLSLKIPVFTLSMFLHPIVSTSSSPCGPVDGWRCKSNYFSASSSATAVSVSK